MQQKRKGIVQLQNVAHIQVVIMMVQKRYIYLVDAQIIILPSTTFGVLTWYTSTIFMDLFVEFFGESCVQFNLLFI